MKMRAPLLSPFLSLSSSRSGGGDVEDAEALHFTYEKTGACA